MLPLHHRTVLICSSCKFINYTVRTKKTSKKNGLIDRNNIFETSIVFRMRILFFCFFLLLLTQSKAQYFDAGVSFGIVGSQVDGDSYGGYNKLGFAANLWVSRSISKKWNATFGIGYIQKGSVKPKNISKNDYSYYKMALQYIEVPIVFNRQVYPKTVVEIGIVNSKLLKALPAAGSISDRLLL